VRDILHTWNTTNTNSIDSRVGTSLVSEVDTVNNTNDTTSDTIFNIAATTNTATDTTIPTNTTTSSPVDSDSHYPDFIIASDVRHHSVFTHHLKITQI
jgi:hypothetical protein